MSPLDRRSGSTPPSGAAVTVDIGSAGTDIYRVEHRFHVRARLDAVAHERAGQRFGGRPTWIVFRVRHGYRPDGAVRGASRASTSPWSPSTTTATLRAGVRRWHRGRPAVTSRAASPARSRRPAAHQPRRPVVDNVPDSNGVRGRVRPPTYRRGPGVPDRRSTVRGFTIGRARALAAAWSPSRLVRARISGALRPGEPGAELRQVMSQYASGRTPWNLGAPVQNPTQGPVFTRRGQAVRGPCPADRATGPLHVKPGRPGPEPAAPRRCSSRRPPGPVRDTAVASPRRPDRVLVRRPGHQPDPRATCLRPAGACPCPAAAACAPRRPVMSNPGAPVRNPVPGPVFFPAVRAVRAPVPQVFSKGRTAANAGAPVRNPSQGPVFFPAVRPARAPVPRFSPRAAPPRTPGAPVRNPVRGPVFRQATSPARIRPSLPPRGRIASSPGGPVRNPVAGRTGPVFYPRVTLAQAQLPLPRRGTCRAIRFYPVQADPSARARSSPRPPHPAPGAVLPLPPRSGVRRTQRPPSNPSGSPPRLAAYPARRSVPRCPPRGQGRPVHPRRYRPALRRHGPPATRSAPAGPRHLPHASGSGPLPREPRLRARSFRQAVQPARARIPQNAPRGRYRVQPRRPGAEQPGPPDPRHPRPAVHQLGDGRPVHQLDPRPAVHRLGRRPSRA